MFIKYNFFYLCMGILILYIGKLYHPVLLCFGIVYLWFLYSQYGFKVCVVYLLLSLLFVSLVSYPKECNDTVLSGKIMDIDDRYIIVKHSGAKIKVYGEFQGFGIDDKVVIEVSYFDIAAVRNDNAFNYQRYLYGQGIMQQASCQKIISHTPAKTIFTWMHERIHQNASISNYVSLFILGIRTGEMDTIYASLSNLSIIHIFSLSGMHIHLLKRWLYSILRFFISDTYLNYIILFVIGIYIYSIPENISFMRAYLVMVIYTFGKSYITKLDALAIACIIMIYRNPFIVYHISFIFSYVMYLIIVLLGKYKYSTGVMYISSIPMILSLQYQLQITSILLAVIFTPMIKVLYILCLWYMVFGRIIAPMIQVFIYVIESMILFSDRIAIYIPFSKPNLFFICMYYYLIGQIILKVNRRRKWKLELCKISCLLLVFFLSSRYPLAGKVVMIDVGQGDSFLIKQPLGKGAILIDTGGSRFRDIASDTLVPYLRSEGIFSIDYVFISHDDFDHSGALESLQEQMPIKEVIRTYPGDMTIGDVKMTMYPLALETRDENANSLIFKVEVNGISYLFTGDIGIEEEKILYDTYGSIPVDVLKIPHHGSKNSTSYTLLHATSPKVAWISAGYNNIYNHPHPIVVDKLNSYGVHVYRTDQMGMVTIWYVGKGNYIFQ